MRSKVDRTCKKTGRPKVNISLSSPKVVLNANDCARFLDSMGKTSILLVEKEGKMVATSSGASSPVMLSPSVSSTIPSQSLSSASINISSTLWAATQTKICKNWNLSTSSMSAEVSDAVKTEKSSTDSTQGEHHSTSVRSQMILKPPKKRRGGDKKFETSPIPHLFNNGDIIHPATSTLEELTDAGSVYRGADSPPYLVPSHRGTFQKHSVEQLLQHQPGPSVNASNIQTLITRSYSHDSRSHISSLNDLPSLSPNTSSVISSSLPPTLEVYKGRTSFAPQLYPKHFSTASQTSKNNSYSGHISSVELPPSLTLSQIVSVNKTMTQSGSFQELPEQIEPMNLSTSCKPAHELLCLQMSSATDSQTAEDVSKIHLQLSLAKDFTESSNSPPISETSEAQVLEGENAESDKPAKEMPGIANDIPFPDDLCSELHSSSLSFKIGLDSDSNGRAIACVSKTPEPHVDFDSPHNNISQVSVKMPHKDTESPTLLCDVESQVVMSSENQVEQNIHCMVEPYIQNEFPISASMSSDTVILKTSSEDVQTACNEELMKTVNETSIAVETETPKKTKRTPKKKIEIPMDEAACADRMHRYSLTVEDIIANFVYIPEPVEEFSLTEEEEATIRDQFEIVNDVSSGENTDIHTIHSVSASVNTISKSNPHNGYNKPSIESEIIGTIRPLKKRPTSVIGENCTELCQDVQKTVENIDSVLAFVANDCTDSPPTVDISVNAGSTIKKKKRQKKFAEDVNNMENGQRKRVKNNIIFNKVHAQNNNDSTGESNCPCSEIGDKKNISEAWEDNVTEDTEKTSKSLQIKKRQSPIKLTSKVDSICTQTEGDGEIAEGKVGTLLKRQAVNGKIKTAKKKKTDGKQNVTSANSATSQTELISDKEMVRTNQVETSDIGESIASTSGSSEQDTPVHEQESKDEIIDTNPQMTDRENHDTGLESGGDDKPVRRYKKRLDFVKCEQCDHQARGRSALSRHLKKVHMLDANMPFKCHHCDYGCTKMASLNRHLFTHGVYPCSRCSFVADERIKLAEHTVEQHKDKVDVKMCKVCNRYIKCDLMTIEQHTQECHGPTPFQCAECEKEFKYASSLRVHYHTHYPDQPKRFKCEQCDYRTNYKANLHKHHKNMHASRDRDIQCPECGKLFSTEDNMRRHRKVHTMVRPFACETCEKTFKTSGALKGHQLVHTATRPYLCNIPGCNRNFRTPKFLKSHQEEFHRLVPKKFFCSVEGCNYSFFKRSHLKRHAITHTGERNFHCTWPGCIKSFRHADNLKVHFRSHTNEKPVQCHLCDFKCKQKNSLFWHKKRVHQVIDVSVCPRRIVHKIKPVVIDDVLKTIKTVSGMVNAENIQICLPATENASQTLALDKPPDLTQITEGLLLEFKSEDSLFQNTAEEKSELLQPPTVQEHVIKTPAVFLEERGPVDLYEFKSDDEAEEETHGSFRRDKSVMNVLTPLPPPPKELLRKNEIQEMKEREKKEKAEKKEQERKEKAERKQQEKNEKVEKKTIEKKAKAERKELELKEKIKMKEQEKKERVEKKELEKKDKLEKKEIEKKEKIEKKQQEKIEKIEKREQERKEKAEKRGQDKKEQTDRKLTAEMEDGENCKEVKSPAKSLPNSLKRRKSPVPASKEEPAVDIKICKKGRQKLQEITADKPRTQKSSHKMKHNDKMRVSSLRRKMVHIKKGGESGESSSSRSSLPSIRAISKKVKRATLKRTFVRRCKRKGKLSPPKRKHSARIKAKNKSKVVKTNTMKAEALITNPVVKGQKSPKPGLRRKYIRKKAASSPREIKEVIQENIDISDGSIKTDTIKSLMTSELSQPPLEEITVPLNSCHEETILLPIRTASPASSEEIMLQGNASPYRDFSDDENLEEQIKTPDSCLSLKQANSPDVQERCEMEGELSPYEKNDNFVMDKHTSHPAEDYSDDEVSNDIPLTPPRAPAPPPVESSEDELESEPEPTPFSVPGPNTPFSVPGPNTPFSIPPPTNLMQQHSVNSEETPMSAVHSVPSMEMQGSVDMQQSLESVEMHQHGSVEMNHSHGSVEMHHSQGTFEVPNSHSSMEIRSHNPVEISSHGSVEMVQSHGSVEMMCHRSITESMPHSEQQVQTSESVMRDISNNHMSEKYELPQSLQEQAQASEADKAYFDQYLKSLSAANNRAANGGLEPSPSGLQQLQAMVGKSHLDSKEINSKSSISCLPTSVITSLESTLPLLSHGDLRARIDAFVSDRHHESLYTRDTPSSLSRISDRQTPLSHSAMGHSPAFDAFSSLNSLHPAAAGGGRENSYLRQPENLFPTPPGTNSFMAEAMFQRQAMTTPFLTPQPSDRSSLSRIPDASSLQSSSSSSLLRRSGTVAGSDMFSPPTMAQSIPRHPFANAWASQEVRPAHWQTPYLSHQQNMAAAGTFFPSKDNYLTGREFMFDPSIRPSTDRSMFPSLSSSQSQDSFQLDRFDLSNYFPNAMTPYGSSPSSLDYSRSAHVAATKPYDDRYRQTTATSATIPDFRGLPPSGSADMFSGLPGVNTGFNIYAGNPMSYHTQHMADNVNSAFLSHSTSAQHALFERDYAAAAHRSLYPQNTPYPFVDERQYPGASKLAHAHSGTSAVAPQERDLVSRSAAPESQMQDPYRSLLYRY